MRWARTEIDIDLRNSRFRGGIATIAAPIHGITRDELDNEDVRRYRRARRVALSGVIALVALLGVASVATAVTIAEWCHYIGPVDAYERTCPDFPAPDELHGSTSVPIAAARDAPRRRTVGWR